MDPIVNNQVPPVAPNPGNQVPPTGLLNTLEYYLVTKAPFQIPANIKEMIVKFSPWINLIFLLTIVPLLIALLGLGATVSVYSPLYAAHTWSISTIISLITLVMGAIALPGLFRRKISGWNMVFYEIIVSFIGSIISGNIIGGVISVVIGAYVLFQVRSYYN